MNNSIHLETQFIEIKENEHLTDVFKREQYPLDSIPTNCVFDKTLPGLGATYSEILAKRNSIIIEPNIPVIDGKVKNHIGLIGVYEGCSDDKIKKHLFNERIKHKKILCTPEGYTKVKRIADQNGVNLYEDYFMLFDECEKITQDIDYREQISIPIKDFFLFRNKAFVSATPLDMRNPDFHSQGFFRLKVKPLYEYRKTIDLITTNSYDNSIIDLLDKLRDSECVCVFMNSTNGINKLVNHLEKQGIKDYKAFCSKKSEIKFKEREIHNSFENLNLPLAKYNFFTSRFFSAVDIYSDRKPDIIIITDLNEAKYSRIDPFTNSIQIYGRFRNTFADGKKFNTLTHITNYGNGETVLLDSEIESYISTSKRIYEQLKYEINNVTNRGEKEALIDSLKASLYRKFIDDDESLNYFKVDNFYDDERIKGYYTSPQQIVEAYEETKHFHPINHENKLYLVGDNDLLEYKKRKSEIERRRFLVKKLDAIYNPQSQFTTEEKEIAKNEFLKVEDRKIQEETQYTIDAYNKIGSQAIKDVNHSKSEINRLIKDYEKEACKRKMFSKDVRDAILKRFPENAEYEKNELFNGVSEIFRNWGISSKVNLNTIKKYYGADLLKGQREGFVKLRSFMPDDTFD